MLVAHIKNTENFGPSSSYYAPPSLLPTSLRLTLWYWGLGHRDHGKTGRELGCKRYHPGNKDWGWLYFSNQRGKGAAEEQAKPPQVSGEAQFPHRHGARWHRRGGREKTGVIQPKQDGGYSAAWRPWAGPDLQHPQNAGYPNCVVPFLRSLCCQNSPMIPGHK